MNFELTKLLGLSINDVTCKEFLNFQGKQNQFEEFGDIFMLDYPDKGVLVYFNSEYILSTIFLYSEGYEDYKQYSGNLPFGLSFKDNRPTIISKLGNPCDSKILQAPDKSLIHKWDKFFFDEFIIHVQYSKINDVDLITLMTIPASKGEY